MLKASSKVLCISIAVTIIGMSTASASVIRAGFDSHTLGPTDDGSSGSEDLGFTINFFGAEYDNVFVNNNGNVTFDSALNQFTPTGLDTIGQAIIAPFFADVDTANGIGNSVTYGHRKVGDKNAFGVTWEDVNYYNNYDLVDQLNSFQLVIIDRSDRGAGNFDIEFNYDSILWETGTGSGGDANGHGGTSARAGFSANTGAPDSFVEFEGSGVNGAFLDGGVNSLAANTNITRDGRYRFRIREAGHPDLLPPVPVPASLPLLLAGFGLFILLPSQRRT